MFHRAAAAYHGVRPQMQGSLRKSVFMAAAIGCAAAIPTVLIVLTNPGWMASPWASIVVVPAVAICPPWWLFWLVLGRPDDLQFALTLCGFAVILNTLLFVPVGALHGSTLSLRPAVRRGLTGASLALLLALGHAFFMSEPAPLMALIWQLAA